MGEKYSYINFPRNFAFHLCVPKNFFSIISSRLERKKSLLICCRIQQKIHETHKICLWLDLIRSSHKGFVYLLYNYSTENTWKYMKLTLGILVNKTTSLFTAIRDSNISRGCVKILEIPEGRGGGKFWGLILVKSRGEGGHTAYPFHGGYFLEPHIEVSG